MKKPVAICAAVIALLAVFQVGAASKKSGDYREIYSNELTTLNYLTSASEVEHFMFANMIDNLVEYDKYGIVKPALATSWSSSPDGLVWTFKLRAGVKWVTWQGKEYADVTAQDFVDAAKYLLNKQNASQTADVFYSVIKNAEDYFNGKITDFGEVGVKAKDPMTVEYTLTKPVPYFVSMLTYVSFLPVNGKFLAETGAKFGTDNKSILYNGAYLMTSFEPQSGRELVKNEKYWDKDHVYIRHLIYKYNKEATTLSPELFLRGETSIAQIPSSIIASWMKDPSKKAQLHPMQATAYSYFYAFNFNPKFDAQYEPENWKVAVNNVEFRKSIFYALDRKAAMLTTEPYTPERRLQATITPKNFASAGGKDFTAIGVLAKVEGFDKAKALKFKTLARKELAGKATFPVKILMPYNAGSVDWANRAQVVEQQLEGLLGKDYVDVIPVSFPATGFLGATRRAGNYALEECNWGPDYADPETYTDPFVKGSNYNWPELATGYGTADKPAYESLVDQAKAEVKNMGKRYALFARAEAYLIGEAMVIPYGHGTRGGSTGGGGAYEVSKLEPFSGPFAPFGLAALKFKGQTVLTRSPSTEEFQRIENQWNRERAAALAKVKD